MKSDTATESALSYTREELVAGIRARNEWAWRAITGRYEPLLRWLAGRYGLSAQDAEDAIQLTWLRCLEHSDQLTDPDKLDGWLATICRRECIRLATKASREVSLTELEMARLIDDRPAGCDPYAEAALRDQCARLHDAIMGLPARQRMVLVELLKRGEQSYRDLSRRLGLPVGSIGPTRQRAVTRLRLDPRLADVASQFSDRQLQARSA
jgi:RNA polymerase sigma factor (sigma-70 family)